MYFFTLLELVHNDVEISLERCLVSRVYSNDLGTRDIGTSTLTLVPLR
jgi:hypothetical protein